MIYIGVGILGPFGLFYRQLEHGFFAPTAAKSRESKRRLMMPRKVYEIDPVKLMRKMTLEVKFVRLREMRFRLWVSTRLIRLGAWVAGMGIEIKDEIKKIDPNQEIDLVNLLTRPQKPEDNDGDN